jgi:hypothetical protein
MRMNENRHPLHERENDFLSGVPTRQRPGGRVLRSNGFVITAAPAHAGCDAKNLEGLQDLLGLDNWFSIS